MKYTSQTEKDQIKKEVKKLLITHGLTIRSFCEKYNYSLSKAYQMLGTDKRYHIDHEEVTKIINAIDSTVSLKSVEGKMVIS